MSTRIIASGTGFQGFDRVPNPQKPSVLTLQVQDTFPKSLIFFETRAPENESRGLSTTYARRRVLLPRESGVAVTVAGHSVAGLP